jgi:hypothetical protein
MTETTPYNLLTHNGIITMRNPATGNHRTVRITTQGKDEKFAPGQRILSLLTGPDKWIPFAFVGVRDFSPTVNVWWSKRGANTEKSDWERIALMVLYPDHYLGRGIEYMFEGRCRVCNRSLTNPESIESGIGPVCAGRI